jgi:N-acetylglutamate synthase-like GNAT family acetyltransferase
MLLMSPSIKAGNVLSVSEEAVAHDIDQFYVYCVNDAIIASAKLIDYGAAAELGKFCTLPRYRGRGRARKLARNLIQRAREEGKVYVFGLSTSKEMWDFFKDLGFTETPRETLPDDWKRNYDFNRPSRAFRLDL